MKFVLLALFCGFNFHNYDDVINYCTNFERVVSVIEQIKYNYDRDEFRRLQEPAETLKLGYGDCADIAILGKDLLERIGYKVKMLRLILYGNIISHIIIEVQHDNHNYIFSNDKIYKDITVHEFATEKGFNGIQVIEDLND